MELLVLPNELAQQLVLTIKQFCSENKLKAELWYHDEALFYIEKGTGRNRRSLQIASFLDHKNDPALFFLPEHTKEKSQIVNLSIVELEKLKKHKCKQELTRVIKKAWGHELKAS